MAEHKSSIFLEPREVTVTRPVNRNIEKMAEHAVSIFLEHRVVTVIITRLVSLLIRMGTRERHFNSSKYEGSLENDNSCATGTVLAHHSVNQHRHLQGC